MVVQLDIGYFTKRNGANIAYGMAGSGLPVLMAAPWVSSLDGYQTSPDTFVEHLAANYQLIVYDKQGTGLSERQLTLGEGFERHADEIVELLDHLGAPPVRVIGTSQAGPVAIDFAARYRHRTSGVLIASGYVNGPRIFFRKDVQESIVQLIRTHWGMGAKVLTDMLWPDLDSVSARQMAEFQRSSAEADVAASLLEEIYETDVSDRLPEVRVPTLVFHRRGDRSIPFRGGQEIAAGIEGARFMPLDGVSHGIFDEGDLDQILPIIDEFLGGGDVTADTTSLKVVLFTDLAGSTAMQSRLGDAGAHEVVRTHDAAMRVALEEFNGREIKHTGDGMMAAFGSAADAVNCALTVRGDIATYNDTHGGEELLVRFGLNAGEPIAEDDDLFGLSVTLAARIGNWGEPGQVLCSNVVRELLLGKGFEFTSVGSAELKGLDEPVPLFEVGG